MSSLIHIRSALYGQPWLITDDGLDLICGIVEAHAAGGVPEFVAQMAAGNQPPKRRNDPYMAGNIGVVPIMGPVFPRANMMTQMSGATSVEEIHSALDFVSSKSPEAIVLHIDSPGGAVLGGFELSDRLHSIREGVPMVAVVEGVGASLAYLFASQADEIVLSRMSVVGSISVVARLETEDRRMRNAGVDSMTLRTGTMKQAEDTIAGGNTTTAIMNSVTRRIDMLHGEFKKAVKRGRPGMDAEAVSNGAIFVGQEAVDAGLADGIESLSEVLQRLGAG
jgi:ClpP class serine protease